MNSYMLPHGTRAVARPRSTMHTRQQPDAGVDQGEPGPADALVEGALRRVGDQAGGGAVGARPCPAATSSRSATFLLRA